VRESRKRSYWVWWLRRSNAAVMEDWFATNAGPNVVFSRDNRATFARETSSYQMPLRVSSYSWVIVKPPGSWSQTRKGVNLFLPARRFPGRNMRLADISTFLQTDDTHCWEHPSGFFCNDLMGRVFHVARCVFRVMGLQLWFSGVRNEIVKQRQLSMTTICMHRHTTHTSRIKCYQLQMERNWFTVSADPILPPEKRRILLVGVRAFDSRADVLPKDCHRHLTFSIVPHWTLV